MLGTFNFWKIIIVRVFYFNYFVQQLFCLTGHTTIKTLSVRTVWFSRLFIYTVCIHLLTTVPINISVWNFGFGSGLGVNSFKVGRFIPVTCLGPLLTVTWLRLCALEVKVY